VDVLSLSVEKQRALLRGLLSLRMLPATRRGRGFDFDRVQVKWI
jgi:hypothetical protein